MPNWRNIPWPCSNAGGRSRLGVALILVDTKYEFGKIGDSMVYLMDEIHTPDSSRYFYGWLLKSGRQREKGSYSSARSLCGNGWDR